MEKIKELEDCVRELSREAQRLQTNLDRMHEFQSTLYQIDTKVLEWLEAGNKLRGAHIPLEELVSFMKQNQTSSSNTST